MSFSTKLQVRYTDFDEVDLSFQKNKILEILANDGIHEDIYSGLLNAFNHGEESINIDPVYCLELIEKISTLFSGKNFECRGLGDEYFYTWILCVENGQIIFKNQPWESENPFV